ncbi:hypothetical protein QT17_01815 [Thermus sp. 2.9]|uniref:Uncharacterized protein n=1 Tax=Thermus caliditerrae TaxID=1330700 RepID=A0A7C5RE35_9DEIN|nr:MULTISPECIES: hypothetical protein [unclassified Thermus]KHG66075.1 hypothetical protein QT17_01815 [Thermus sp. 2.9]MDW8358093.1 hypothetical protein [Thermus sp.]
MDAWYAELGLRENALVWDLGACPWCGGYEVHVGHGGAAALRRPTYDCCVHGALAGVARLKEAVARTKDPEERAELERDLAQLMRRAAALVAGRSAEELQAAARDVMGRYRFRGLEAVALGLAARMGARR